MISILLPTKDRPNRLARAVDAILAQDYDDFELIIDNGGGPIALDDPHVTILERPVGSFGGANYNRIAKHAHGSLLHVSADDDVMLPGTLADASTIDAEWTYARLQFMDSDEVYDPGEWWHERLWGANFIPLPTVFWTRELFDAAGGFDESLDYACDYELWSRFGARAAPQVREHVDYLYERWPGSVSSQHGHDIEAEVALLQKRWLQIGLGNREV